MAPAQQRLEADDPPRGHLDDGLVVKDELLAFQGAGQLGLQGRALEGGGAHAVLEHPVVAPGLRLRLVHGEVGADKQVGDALGRCGPGDADTGLEADLLVGEQQRRGDPLEELRGDGFGDPLTGVGQQDGELVATEPGHGVVRPDARPQALADGGEDGIGAPVTEEVVDRLEVVEVGIEDGRGAQAATGLVDRLGDPLDEQHPVRQTRERIMGLLPLELGQVPDVEDDAPHNGILEEVGERDLDGVPAPVGVAQASLEAADGGNARRELRKAGAELAGVIGVRPIPSTGSAEPRLTSEPKTRSNDELWYWIIPRPSTTVITSLECSTRERKRASLPARCSSAAPARVAMNEARRSSSGPNSPPTCPWVT